MTDEQYDGTPLNRLPTQLEQHELADARVIVTTENKTVAMPIYDFIQLVKQLGDIQ